MTVNEIAATAAVVFFIGLATAPRLTFMLLAAAFMYAAVAMNPITWFVSAAMQVNAANHASIQAAAAQQAPIMAGSAQQAVIENPAALQQVLTDSEREFIKSFK